MNLGASCGPDDGGDHFDGGAIVNDGAAADTGPGVDAAGSVDASVAATCAGVCACLARACSDYPFAPDCMTACMDPTNNPAWDLSCRASHCGAAYSNHDTECPIASGQSSCH